MLCFALPLAPAAETPALLALSFWPVLTADPDGLWPKAAPLVWVAAGWSAAWPWRGEPAHLMTLVDLALVGPILALGMARDQPRRLQESLLLGGLTAAAAAVLQILLGLATPAHWVGYTWPWGRAYGTMGNPNVLAAYCAGVAPLTLTVAWPRYLRRLSLALLGAACLLTASRGGWFAGAAGLMVILYFHRPRVLPVLLLFGLAAAILPWTPGDRLLAALDGTDPTVAARIDIWWLALRAWAAKPLAGWGMSPPLPGSHPHNLLLEIAVHGGLLALAGFVPLIVFGVRTAMRGPRTPAAAAAMATLASLFVFGFADAFLTHPALASLFWLNWGILIAEGEPLS
ncbi:MAG: O-antigen ligase family protein [Bacteroidota bacterium]